MQFKHIQIDDIIFTIFEAKFYLIKNIIINKLVYVISSYLIFKKQRIR